MRKKGRASNKSSSSVVVCWVMLVVTVCIAVRLLTNAGVNERFEDAVKKYFEPEACMNFAVDFEFGASQNRDMIYSILRGEGTNDEGTKEVWSEDDAEEEHGTESAIPNYFVEEAAVQEKTGKLDYTAVEVFGDDVHLDSSSVELDNDTGLEIDVESLLNSPLSFAISREEPAVLIVHTHGSEAYTPSGEDIYTESDPYRTEDNTYNVVRVGQELKAELESYGIKVIHDTALHDYPSYNGSYNRSFETIAQRLEEYPSIRIVIDLHRDAIENADGTPYRTVAKVGDDTCSQLLFVMGTNASGLDHPAWQENMKLAVKLQYAINTMFPGLAKPICVSEYRYNQHMTSGSMILEVGCTGNTLQESISSMKYFAAAAAKVIETVSEKEN